ncbi:fungal-specific transcription factor domain-containing protein [Plectosphaerella plurivora]|uniref:Fungal-specific transcription factor domain-containing protein n=1 Tax=Plectosphaerella plurivora TaxID=936078 RepID=A0A9P9AGH7_9PEZI|nr:fungal-specific transcription factor domain-containing protein [Plectosphaerella plurivora]
MDICEPERPSTTNHSIVSVPPVKSLPPEDLEYLRKKGVFSLPPPHILEALIRCYFHHVHPFAPILDPYQFISDYENGRASLLLLWSMFVASASYIDGNLLTCDVYSSRTAIKRAVFQRAKALYDTDYESDKVTLIQSVFLMGHWYTSFDDRAGPWYWQGAAISLLHTIGLHRLPVLASEDSRAIKPFWRRLWWAIYCREAWLSLGQGRPMRISLDDSDTALPGLHDKDERPPSISDELVSKFVPEELDDLFNIWTCHTMLGISLGTILSTHYRAKAPRPTKEELELAENGIRAFHLDAPKNINQSRLIASHYYQFRLYFESTIIVLYRPYILESPKEMLEEQQESWKTFACQKTRTAATNASNTVASMMAEGLIGLSHTLTVLALIPPMQIHLFEKTSQTLIVRQMGSHNLSLCMLAMEELGKLYISAIAARKLFEAAIQKVDKRQQQEEEAARLVATGQPSPAMLPSTTLDNWPEGYWTSTADVIADVWAPWNSGMGTHSDTWMDQDTNGPLGNGDITHFFSSVWED